jgi:hypothetical protein
MKASSIAFLLTVLIVGASCTGSCADNKFLGWLKSADAKNVKANPETGSNFEICNDIWKVEGTCCSVGEIKLTFKNKMDVHKQGWGKFISGLNQVRKMLNKVEKMTTNRDSVKAAMQKAKEADANQLEGLDSEQATQLIEKSKSFSAEVEEFKKGSKDCFDYVIKLAGTAFCYGCSAKESDRLFFSNIDGKLTINQASSTALAEKCLKTWGFMHMVGGMMQMLGVLNKQKKTDAPAPKRPPGNKPNHAGVPEADVFNAFKNCKSATPTGDCTQEALNKLVAAHFNIMAPPKRANDDNMKEDMVSSAPTRLLEDVVYTGDSAVSANSGADLTKSVGAPEFGSSIDTSGITTGDEAASGHASLASILALVVALCMHILN